MNRECGRNNTLIIVNKINQFLLYLESIPILPQQLLSGFENQLRNTEHNFKNKNEPHGRLMNQLCIGKQTENCYKLERTRNSAKEHEAQAINLHHLNSDCNCPPKGVNPSNEKQGAIFYIFIHHYFAELLIYLIS